MLLSAFEQFKVKGEQKMFLRFVLLGISFVVILFIFDILVPKIKLKYRLHKELQEKKKKKKAFKNKMKELEIK